MRNAPAGFLVALLALCAATPAQAVPLEVYGQLPAFAYVALSPDGSKIAYLAEVGKDRVIAATSLADGKALGVVRVGEEKIHGLSWIDERHITISISRTEGLPIIFHRGPNLREWGHLLIYDLETKESVLVPDTRALSGTMGVVHERHIFDSTNGEPILRRVNGHTQIFVRGSDLIEGAVLVRYDVDTGLQSVVTPASKTIAGWLVDPNGTIAAAEYYDQKDRRWTMQIRRDGNFETVASGEAALDMPLIWSFGPSEDTALLRVIENGDQVWKVLSLKDGGIEQLTQFDGKFTRPIIDRATGRLIGATLETDEVRHIFLDSQYEARWKLISHSFEGALVSIASYSDDFKKFILRVEGAKFGYRYVLVDLVAHKASPIGDIYAGVTEPFEVRRIEYEAADGFKIPAFLTLPRGREAKKLPLVVLPHGGPAAHDTANFDWWSQALADQGYAVLRPNYRGSQLSEKFLAAGYGEFGRKMQTDLSDGVRFLVKEGIVDPVRVCIAGASYGGYAALAGVTLDPGVYRCAVSLAGISDIKEFMLTNDEYRDDDDYVQRYWDRYTGTHGPNDPMLDSISPIRHVDALSVPVLLIHGDNDIVVPFSQSQMFYDAARKANKDITFVTLKNEDHGLSHSETRLKMLQETVAFLRAHNPPNP